MVSKAREIESNQEREHQDLLKLARRHRRNNSLRPISDHTLSAFNLVQERLQHWDGPIIIDACCGVGESTIHIASNNPDCKVIGVDKSAVRVNKHDYYKRQLGKTAQLENLMVIQADLKDFWNLVESSNRPWNVTKQYLLYPNPYPKRSQVDKRWYATSSFKTMLACCPMLESRSNWKLYLQELKLVLKEYGIESNISEVLSSPITPFERKYLESGQTCWKLITERAD